MKKKKNETKNSNCYRVYAFVSSFEAEFIVVPYISIKYYLKDLIAILYIYTIINYIKYKNLTKFQKKKKSI